MQSSVCWFAPGRVNLIGEHTDYNGGYALPFAIERGCRATVMQTNDDVIEIRSKQKPTAVRIGRSQLRPGADWLRGAGSWAGYAAGVVWAASNQTHFPHQHGWRIALDSDVPEGAGLSSSAALGCSVAGAVAEVLGTGATGAELAELARQAESQFVGAPTGGMDQLASALGAPDHAVLCDMRSGTVEPVPLRLADAGLALLVVDTGAPHSHVDGEYAQRRANCQDAARALGVSSLREATLADLDRLPTALLRRRARHVVTENARVLTVAERLRSGEISAIGDLLTESHVSMRDDFEITVGRIDLAVSSLLAAGALGARMTGGGFGGSVIALVAAERSRDLVGSVTEAFAAAGLARPRSFLARPSAGAHRVTTYARTGT